jgi:integrase/recombinase XerD
MPQQRSTTIADAFELFILDCKSRRFTRKTLQFYEGRLGLFMRWCGETKPLHEVTSTDIKKYLISLQERDLSSAYIHSFGRAIRTFCNYCVRDELIEKSPFAKVKMPTLAKKILPALTTDEVAVLLDACMTQRDKTLMLFLLDSGLRASEAVNLNVGDVEIRTGCVTVHQGKQQKDRSTFVGATTRKAIKLYLMERSKPEAHEPLFVSERDGERLTYFGLAQAIRRLRTDTGVTFSAHTLRRTFAINCLRGGMDIFILAKLMGHADITVLKPYLDIVRDDLHSAHERYGPVDNM